MPQSEFMLCCIVTLGILCCSFLSVGALNFNLCTYSMCKTYINFTPSSKYLFYERCISVATATLRSILRRRQRCSRDYGACRQRRGMRWQFYGGWSDDARRISGCIQTLPRGREERREECDQNWHLVLVLLFL